VRFFDFVHHPDVDFFGCNDGLHQMDMEQMIFAIQVFLIGDLDFDFWIDLLAFRGASSWRRSVRLIVSILGRGARHLELGS
jgi:hypothetical protein